jgi:hypothetical protein
MARTYNDFKSREETFLEAGLEQTNDITSCGQVQGKSRERKNAPRFDRCRKMRGYVYEALSNQVYMTASAERVTINVGSAFGLLQQTSINWNRR